MTQEIKVVAVTKELGTENYDAEKLNEELTILSGRAAGICYMPDDYFEDGIQNTEKALTRAAGNAKSGHHSVYDHGHITMIIKTNKMMAMILNSLGVYATSEKSARYTKMQPETELELQLYNKWIEKIQHLVLKKYPDTDDEMLGKRASKKLNISVTHGLVRNGELTIAMLESDVQIFNELKKSTTLPSYKIAQENARYMISVYTPTAIEYTTSFRQIFLIIDYLSKLETNLSYAEDKFSKSLIKYVVELKDEFKKVVGTERLHDNKNQYIRFLEAQHTGSFFGPEKDKKFVEYRDLQERLEDVKKEVIADSYTVSYYGSLAMLAQAQRHRTLRYTMLLREPGQYGFYIPEIIKDAGNKCIDEWINDITKVAYCVPQGTMVRITEQGIFEDFILKCKERLCGRAQLEVMLQTKETCKKFIDNKDNLSLCNQELLDDSTEYDMISEKDKVCARCRFTDFNCTEGCKWGPGEALTRLV